MKIPEIQKRGVMFFGKLFLCGTAVFLLAGCGRTLSREEATTLLDSIVYRTGYDSSFRIPTDYGVETSSKENDAYSSVSFAYSSGHHYYHKKVTITDSAGASNWTEVWRYVDASGKMPVYVAAETASDSSVRYLSLSDTPEQKWNEDTEKLEEYHSDLVTIPVTLDTFMKKLSSDVDTLVLSENYSSTGDGNLDMDLKTLASGDTNVFKASFKNYLVTEYDVSSNEKIQKTSYSWNNIKYSYPSLSTASIVSSL